MNMDWTYIQAPPPGSSNQPAHAAQGGQRPEEPRFKDMLEQSQGKPEQPEQPAESGQGPAQAGRPNGEITDEQRVLAAALAVQAAIVPVEPAGETEAAVPETAVSETAVGLLPEAGPARAVREPVGEPMDSRAAGQPAQPGSAPGDEAPRTAPSGQTVQSQEPVQEAAVHTKSAPVQREAPAAQTEDDAGKAGFHSDELGYLFRENADVVVKVGEAHVLDTESGDMEAQLARRVGEALEKGWDNVDITLSPANLGTLVVRLDRSPDGALHLSLHTSSEKTANLLGEHVGGLTALLQNGNQGQPVTVEVQRSQEEQQAQYHQQQYQEQNGGQQQNRQQQERRQSHDSAQDFMQQLRLGLVTLDGEAS